MSKAQIEVEKCYSCNKALSPGVEGHTRFQCPSCGAKIVRCGNCRRIANQYKCPSCNFIGP